MPTLLKNPNGHPASPDGITIAQPGTIRASKSTGRGWVDQHAAEQTDREHRRHLVLSVALLLFITAGDVVMIKSTLDHVLRNFPINSWVLGVGLAVLAVALMWRSGAHVRKGEATARRMEYLRAGVLAAAWLGVGFGLWWLRWHAAQFTQSAPSFEGSLSRSNPRPHEHELAIVLLAFYAATGVLSAIDGHALTNPIASAMRAARRRVKQLEAELAARKARVVRLVEHRDIHEHQLETVESRRDERLASVKSLGDELKELVRVEIAAHLGDPRCTGLVHEPLRSRNGRAANPATEQQ